MLPWWVIIQNYFEFMLLDSLIHQREQFVVIVKLGRMNGCCKEANRYLYMEQQERDVRGGGGERIWDRNEGNTENIMDRGGLIFTFALWKASLIARLHNFAQINNEDVQHSTHEEAVNILTSSGERVTMEIYRERIINKRMTPVSKINGTAPDAFIGKYFMQETITKAEPTKVRNSICLFTPCIVPFLYDAMISWYCQQKSAVWCL